MPYTFAFGIFFLLLTSLWKQDFFSLTIRQSRVCWQKDKSQLDNDCNSYNFKRRGDLGRKTPTRQTHARLLSLKVTHLKAGKESDNVCQSGFILRGCWATAPFGKQSQRPRAPLLISTKQIHWWRSRTHWASRQHDGKQAFKQILRGFSLCMKTA